MYEILRTIRLFRRGDGGAALNGMNLSLFRGEILGIAGLNGSGRTALTDVLSGLKGYAGGSIYVEDRPAHYHSVLEAQQLGIFCVRHPSTLIDELTVAQNIGILPPQRMGGWRIRPLEESSQAQRILQELEVPIPVDKRAGELTLAEKHMVEIARAALAGVKALLLNDIMLSYTDEEYHRLLSLIHRLQQRQVAIIVFDSRLERLLEVARRIIVMRAGESVGFFDTDKYDCTRIQRVLTSSDFVADSVSALDGDPEGLLRVDGLCSRFLQNVSFYIRKGEMVGFIDEGIHSCRSLVDVLTGNEQPLAGQMTLCGKRLIPGRPMANQHIGYIGYYKASLFPHLSLSENLMIAGMGHSSSRLRIHTPMERFVVRQYAQKLGIDPQNFQREVETADNRTQINVAMYKWIIAGAKLIVMDNTFSGTDITMHNCIYSFISEAKEHSMGILFTSPSAQEVYKLCDRVYRMENGRILKD